MAVIFFCPSCWAELPAKSAICPACGYSLATDDADFVDKLIGALRHSVPTRAALAIQILSEMLADRRAIVPLIELLDSAQDAYVLKCAAVALGRFADARAVPALAGRVLDLKTPLVARLAAVEALDRIGGAPARAALDGALRDPNAVVRNRARQALDRSEDMEDDDNSANGTSWADELESGDPLPGAH